MLEATRTNVQLPIQVFGSNIRILLLNEVPLPFPQRVQNRKELSKRVHQNLSLNPEATLWMLNKPSQKTYQGISNNYFFVRGTMHVVRV